jgi:hypothetical protein
MHATITSPVSTATPESVMKPMPAEIDSGMPRTHNARTPPVSASGTPLNTIAASFAEPKVMKSSPNTSSSDTGTTTLSRVVAEASCSNVPP